MLLWGSTLKAMDMLIRKLVQAQIYWLTFMHANLLLAGYLLKEMGNTADCSNFAWLADWRIFLWVQLWLTKLYWILLMCHNVSRKKRVIQWIWLRDFAHAHKESMASMFSSGHSESKSLQTGVVINKQKWCKKSMCSQVSPKECLALAGSVCRWQSVVGVIGVKPLDGVCWKSWTWTVFKICITYMYMLAIPTLTDPMIETATSWLLMYIVPIAILFPRNLTAHQIITASKSHH